VALAPDNARGHSNLGGTLVLLRQWDRAFPALEKATALNPSGPNFSNLATAYFRQGRFADAASAFERAIALGTKNYRVWLNLASAYQWVPASESKARAAFARAAELGEEDRRVNPRDALLVAGLADCYAHLGDLEKARRLVGEAEALGPRDARVFLISAQVLEEIGDRAQALTRVAAALDRGLSRDDLESTRSLDALRADPAYAAVRK
jgi:tetratricopeptide (TPR) repeat protein